MSHVRRIGTSDTYTVVVGNSATALLEHPERFETAVGDPPAGAQELIYRSDLPKTSNYTTDEGDFGGIVKCNGTFTVTLLTAVGHENQVISVKNINSGVITIDTTGGQTIDGASTETLNSRDILDFQSDGANWILI